jgi:hypothetical protein
MLISLACKQNLNKLHSPYHYWMVICYSFSFKKATCLVKLLKSLFRWTFSLVVPYQTQHKMCFVTTDLNLRYQTTHLAFWPWNTIFLTAVLAPLVTRCGNLSSAISKRDDITYPNRFGFHSHVSQFMSNITLNLSTFHMFTLYNHQSIAYGSHKRCVYDSNLFQPYLLTIGCPSHYKHRRHINIFSQANKQRVRQSYYLAHLSKHVKNSRLTHIQVHKTYPYDYTTQTNKMQNFLN